MASDGEALTELCLEDWWWAAKNRQKDNCTPDSELEVFRITRDWLQAYFADERPSLSQAPPMNPAATPFQHEVWQLVAEIPYGMTASYGEIAAELSERRGGGRMAAQAVGGAVKHNPITIIVPCHRVVGSGRAFGGYGGRHRTPPQLPNNFPSHAEKPMWNCSPSVRHRRIAPSATIQSLQWKAHGSRQTAAVHELGP